MPRNSRDPTFASVWKEALVAFLHPFMGFFFPDVQRDIAPARGYERLDGELQEIVAESGPERRAADKLVRVWRTNGEQVWLRRAERRGGQRHELRRVQHELLTVVPGEPSPRVAGNRGGVTLQLGQVGDGIHAVQLAGVESGSCRDRPRQPRVASCKRANSCGA